MTLKDINGKEIVIGSIIKNVENDGTDFVGKRYKVIEDTDVFEIPGKSLVAVGNGLKILLYPERTKLFQVVDE